MKRWTKPAALALVGFVVSWNMTACAPKPVVEEPKVDAKWVEGVSHDHNHEVLKCYEDALKTNQKLAGSLVLEVDAAEDGSVRRVSIKKGLASDFDACVLAKAKLWTYPWIKSETLAIQDGYKLSLNPQGQPVAEFQTPGMDRQVIAAVVRKNMSDVVECYKSALASKSDLEGKLEMGWDILGSGDVTNVHVEKALDPKIDRCVTGKIQKWKFPQPPNRMVEKVKFPFRFSANSKP